MIKKSIIVILLIFLSNIYGALVINEVSPNPTLKTKKYDSIIVFPFDGKRISKKYDFLTISKRFQKDLLTSFENRTSIHAIFNSKPITVKDSLHLEVQKGSLKIKDYTQRSDSKIKNIHSNLFKQIPIHLVGTIDAFFPSPKYDDSYIQVTIQLIDSKSKVIYWTTTIAGCYQFVVNSIADSIEQKRFVGPTIKDEKNYEWVNPKQDRLLIQAIGYNLGGAFSLGTLKANWPSSWFGQLELYFTLPYLLPIRNKLSLGISKKLQDTANTNVQHIFTPLYLSFIYDLPYIYNFDWMPKELSVAPYFNIGFLYQNISFPGYTYQVESLHNLTYLISPGVSIEYYILPMTFRYKDIMLSIHRLGFIANFNFNFFEFEDYTIHYKSSGFFNFNLGFKIYL